MNENELVMNKLSAITGIRAAITLERRWRAYQGRGLRDDGPPERYACGKALRERSAVMAALTTGCLEAALALGQN